MSKPLQLFQRAEVRLALAAGISNGFAVISGLPFAYYAPLSVLAAMGTNYGSTLELGRQRLLGTLLGAVVLLVCFEGLRDVPLPLGIAIALGSQRLLGGLLRLEVGYKVGGLVIVMGWLAHNEQFGAWIPLRLFWSVVGILVSLLSMELLWPSSAVLEGWQQWSTLCGQLAQALRRVAARTAGQQPQALAAARSLRAALMALRTDLPAVRRELGGSANDHPVLALVACLDESCSRLIGLLLGLQRAHAEGTSPALQSLRHAEATLMDAVAGRLELWSEALARTPARRSRAVPRLPAAPFVPPDAWLKAEALLADPAINQAGLEQLERLAGRQQLCRQLIDALHRSERQWQRCSQ
ncbi:MAG: FUSC family protein [Cyanobacteria bacterium M_surface_7_m2_040]|nr:FUSC family protein [Cyanobacteria bacterium K_Offshore_0m_m2_072]MBM5826916.1 FUSC family protein [Cyanobacteria bacterium M_surface_7_m2_040]